MIIIDNTFFVNYSIINKIVSGIKIFIFLLERMLEKTVEKSYNKWQ